MAETNTRALLATARKERRVKHHHASYTSLGNLLCNLCECPVKSDAAWGSHLRSTGHTLRLSREQDAIAARGASASAGSNKRKANGPVDEQETEDDDHKKQKVTEPVIREARVTQEPVTMPGGERPAPAVSQTPTAADANADLAALEASLASMEREHQASNAERATISAPALTAQELAAQAREEQSAQRGRRDAELEDEREEAARHLEEEFADMEGYEDRVKKLKERREKLRVGNGQEAEPAGEGVLVANGIDRPVEEKSAQAANDSEDEEDEDEDDNWAFGAR